MVKTCSAIANEEGSAIVIAILALAVLSMIGLSSMSTSITESRIIRNERIYQRDFYVADSGWKDGAYWLEKKSRAPRKINTNQSLDDDDLKLVRNFGNANANVPNDHFADDTEDGDIDSILYWYNVQHNTDKTVAGSGRDYREFTYVVKSNANKVQEIEVRMKKIYKVGY